MCAAVVSKLAFVGSGWLNDYDWTSTLDCDPSLCCCFTGSAGTLSLINATDSYQWLGPGPKLRVRNKIDSNSVRVGVACKKEIQLILNGGAVMPLYNAFTFTVDNPTAYEGVRMQRDPSTGTITIMRIGSAGQAAPQCALTATVRAQNGLISRAPVSASPTLVTFVAATVTAGLLAFMLQN